MSERIETVEKVRLKLWEALDGKGKKDPRVVAQVAQVEATLLLVEQQRIANILFLASHASLMGEEFSFLADEAVASIVHAERIPATPFQSEDDSFAIDEGVKEALGL